MEETFFIELANKFNCKSLKALANEYWCNKDYIGAFFCYKKLLDMDSEHQDPIVYARLGHICSLNGEPLKSIVYFENGYEKDKNNILPAWLLISFGLELKKSSKFTQAIRVFNSAKERPSGSVKALCHMANCYSEMGNIDQSIRTYFRVSQSNEELPEWAYQDFIDILYKNEQYQDVLLLTSQANSYYSENIDFLIKCALAEKQLLFIAESISTYRKILQSFNAYPHWIILALADLLVEVGNFSEAKFFYKQHLTLSTDNNREVYLKLARLYSLMSDNYTAIAYMLMYESVTKLPHEFFFYELSMLYQKIKDLDKAKLNHLKGLSQRLVLDKNNGIIYCPIAKNACTVFRKAMVGSSNLQQEFINSGINIHEFISRNNNLKANLKLLQESNQHFKFIVLRNPYKRLVSAYIDKIAKHETPEDFVIDLIEKVQSSNSERANIKKSITFRSFINYIASTSDYELNEHWASQSLYFLDQAFQYDYVGCLENASDTFNQIEQRLSIKIDKSSSPHKTQYTDKSVSSGLYTDVYPDEIRKLNGFPDYCSFFDNRLLDIFNHRFKRDIQIYEKYFGKIQPPDYNK